MHSSLPPVTLFLALSAQAAPAQISIQRGLYLSAIGTDTHEFYELKDTRRPRFSGYMLLYVEAPCPPQAAQVALDLTKPSACARGGISWIATRTSTLSGA